MVNLRNPSSTDNFVSTLLGKPVGSPIMSYTSSTSVAEATILQSVSDALFLRYSSPLSRKNKEPGGATSPSVGSLLPVNTPVESFRLNPSTLNTSFIFAIYYTTIILFITTSTESVDSTLTFKVLPPVKVTVTLRSLIGLPVVKIAYLAESTAVPLCAAINSVA